MPLPPSFSPPLFMQKAGAICAHSKRDTTSKSRKQARKETYLASTLSVNSRLVGLWPVNHPVCGILLWNSLKQRVSGALQMSLGRSYSWLPLDELPRCRVAMGCLPHWAGTCRKEPYMHLRNLDFHPGSGPLLWGVRLLSPLLSRP